MKLIKKFLKGKKFSNTPTGRAMQRLYDLEHGITMQKALPEVEVFPNRYDIDNNGYSNSFAIPLEQRPTTFSQGETSQPYVPKKLDELGWLNRTFGINNFSLGIRELIGNPANVVPTVKTIESIKALTSMNKNVTPINVERRLMPTKRDYVDQKVIPTNNTPIVTSENITSMTPEQWTSLQDAAIAKGDMTEAQRLRDLHFKTAAPNTQITDVQYHGSSSAFNVFDPTRIGNRDLGWFGRGYYFTPSRDYAAMYGDPRPFYINAENVYTKGTGAVHFGRESSPQAKAWLRMQSKHGKGAEAEALLDDLRSSDAVRDAMHQTKPYDGMFEEIVTKNNNQMKLQDAVTYDDKGIRIPLGKRDNFSSPDIRWGLFPLTIGGSYVEYNKHKTDNNL